MRFIEKRRRSVVVPIISLIDILAILLVFFIITSTFREAKSFANITLPSTVSLSTRTSAEVRVELAIGPDSRIWLGAEEVALERLAAQLKLLKGERPDVKLELKADENAPLKTLVGVWDALTRAGIRVNDVPARILLEKPAS